MRTEEGLVRPSWNYVTYSFLAEWSRIPKPDIDTIPPQQAGFTMRLKSEGQRTERMCRRRINKVVQGRCIFVVSIARAGRKALGLLLLNFLNVAENKIFGKHTFMILSHFVLHGSIISIY